MLTFDQIHKLIADRVSRAPAQFTRAAVHVVDPPVARGAVLSIGPNRYPVQADSWLVVIDEAPGAYWAHPVRYELHDRDTGQVTVVHEQFPLQHPGVGAKMVAVKEPPGLRSPTERGFFFDGRIPVSATRPRLGPVHGIRSYAPPRPCAAQQWALFYAGMNNMSDFHNDFVNMRDVLIERYGYDPAHIIVAMGDGSDYVDLPVDHDGTSAGLDAALDSFAPGGSRALGANDSLFLYTFNHGGPSGLCTWPSWGTYTPAQLRTKLDALACGQLLVAMNQCNSGGFVTDVLATTGPSQVAIMTTCSATQSGHPAAGLDNGYFSVALATALNWAFPASIPTSFPGFVAGTVTAQDGNGDGMVAFSEAFAWVQSMMAANHQPTINGIETPQYGESSPGAGASMFFGRPQLEIPDGSPVWESPDVFLLDPAFVPDDTNTIPGSPAYWGDDYRPDTTNRLVARVYNSGCAPCRNVSVELRVMSFGSGSAITLVGTATLDQIDAGSHAYAWVDWSFPSAQIHRCALARATCTASPAQPFDMGNIASDGQQAQRNLDPIYVAPGFDRPIRIERTITIARPELLERMKVVPRFEQPRLAAEVRELERGPRGRRELRLRIDVPPNLQRGEVERFPIAFEDRGRDVGGVTVTVQVAEGRLEGRVIARGRMVNRGEVRLDHLKLADVSYVEELGRDGRFSFRGICPGPYRVRVKSRAGSAEETLFVIPNRVTRRDIVLEPPVIHLGGRLMDAGGNPLVEGMATLRDPTTGALHMVRTDAHGYFTLHDVAPGELELTTPLGGVTRVGVGPLERVP